MELNYNQIEAIGIENFITVKEATSITKLSRTSIWRRIKDGTYDYYYNSGTIMIHKKTLFRKIKKNVSNCFKSSICSNDNIMYSVQKVKTLLTRYVYPHELIHEPYRFELQTKYKLSNEQKEEWLNDLENIPKGNIKVGSNKTPIVVDKSNIEVERVDVLNAIDRLEEPFRAIIILRYWLRRTGEPNKFEFIGHHLNMPVMTVIEKHRIAIDNITNILNGEINE